MLGNLYHAFPCNFRAPRVGKCIRRVFVHPWQVIRNREGPEARTERSTFLGPFPSEYKKRESRPDSATYYPSLRFAVCRYALLGDKDPHQAQKP